MDTRRSVAGTRNMELPRPKQSSEQRSTSSRRTSERLSSRNANVTNATFEESDSDTSLSMSDSRHKKAFAKYAKHVPPPRMSNAENLDESALFFKEVEEGKRQLRHPGVVYGIRSGRVRCVPPPKPRPSQTANFDPPVSTAKEVTPLDPPDPENLNEETTTFDPPVSTAEEVTPLDPPDPENLNEETTTFDPSASADEEVTPLDSPDPENLNEETAPYDPSASVDEEVTPLDSPDPENLNEETTPYDSSASANEEVTPLDSPDPENLNEKATPYGPSVSTAEEVTHLDSPDPENLNEKATLFDPTASTTEEVTPLNSPDPEDLNEKATPFDPSVSTAEEVTPLNSTGNISADVVADVPKIKKTTEKKRRNRTLLCAPRIKKKKKTISNRVIESACSTPDSAGEEQTSIHKKLQRTRRPQSSLSQSSQCSQAPSFYSTFVKGLTQQAGSSSMPNINSTNIFKRKADSYQQSQRSESTGISEKVLEPVALHEDEKNSQAKTGSSDSESSSPEDDYTTDNDDIDSSSEEEDSNQAGPSSTSARKPQKKEKKSPLFSNDNLVRKSGLIQLLDRFYPKKKFSRKVINALLKKFTQEMKVVLDDAASKRVNANGMFSFRDLEATLVKHQLISDDIHCLLATMAAEFNTSIFEMARGLIIPEDDEFDTKVYVDDI